MTAHSRTAALFVATAISAAFCASAAFAADDAAEREARWNDLSKDIFGGKQIEQNTDLIALDTPKRAEDASLVPIAIKVSKPDDVKQVTLVIDDNPGPVAAKIDFGPAGDPSLTKLRARVNTYTNVHAVAQTKDGKLYQVANFVKASGGCSAPVGSSDEEAMKGMGDMRLKVRDELQAGKTAQATLMIRHPNFNGMQMDQVKRTYTPARFINEIKVSFNDKSVFDWHSDISLSTNPVIEFGFKPDGAKGQFKVAVTDTAGGHWDKTFDVPTQSN